MLNCKNKDQLIGMTSSKVSSNFLIEGLSSTYEINLFLESAKSDDANNFESKLTKIDGEEFWASITLTLITVLGKSVIHALIKDISKQKEYEQELLNEPIFRDFIYIEALKIVLQAKEGDSINLEKLIIYNRQI